MSTAEHDNTSMLIAWDLLKLKLASEKWTVSDHFNSQGFFAWGWAARKQYDTPMQTRITELEAENERLIKVSLFKESVAGVLRAQLADAKQVANDCRIVADNAIAEAQKNKWMPVSERLPKPETECVVWVLNRYGAAYPYCTTWSMQREAPVMTYPNNTVEIGMGWDDFDFEQVSHWMPLPAAPAIAEGKQA